MVFGKESKVLLIPSQAIGRQLQELSLDFEVDRRMEYRPKRREPVFSAQETDEVNCLILHVKKATTKLLLGIIKMILIETFMLNAIYSGNISTMVPKQDLFGGTLSIVRPMAYLEKNEVCEIAAGFKLEVVKNLCPLSDDTRREKVRSLLADALSTMNRRPRTHCSQRCQMYEKIIYYENPCRMSPLFAASGSSGRPHYSAVQKTSNSHLLQAVSAVIAGLDVRKSPPANANPIYRKIAEITGCEDPYYEKKRASNQQAMKIVPGLRQEIQGTDHELASAVRFAIAGNIIDYGASRHLILKRLWSAAVSTKLAVDHFSQFSDAIMRLKKGSKILYLTDNCGEIVYDSLLIEYLYQRVLILLLQ